MRRVIHSCNQHIQAFKTINISLALESCKHILYNNFPITPQHDHHDKNSRDYTRQTENLNDDDKHYLYYSSPSPAHEQSRYNSILNNIASRAHAALQIQYGYSLSVEITPQMTCRDERAENEGH